MTCQHCCGADKVFGDKDALKQARRYQKHGPRKTSRLLIEGIKNNLNGEKTVLDIGGGIGVVHHELLKAGLNSATQVDASVSYTDKAIKESEKNGFQDRTEYRHGDFLDVAEDIKTHDVVVLDKVVCCYPHMTELLSQSILKTGSLFALVYPKNNLIGKAIILSGNLLFWFKRNPFRVFLHSNEQIRGHLKTEGFNRVYYKVSYPWNIEVYKR
jgi:2-polyprenyl-3-methyl-5-hydroxy-6-metoxy-1,4-benzoquinol methylase